MDEQQKKTALRTIPYGIYLVGASDGEQKDAFIGSWVMQTSFKPPLVTIAVREANHARELIRNSGVFSVSIFGADQKTLASRFLRRPVFEGNEVNGVIYKTDQTGAPVLEQVPAYFECKVVQIVQQGDHDLIIGEVINASAEGHVDALTTTGTGWKYGG